MTFIMETGDIYAGHVNSVDCNFLLNYFFLNKFNFVFLCQ